MTTYTTIQGDCWDAIAHKVYGSSSHTGYLMAANFPYLDTFLFDAGVVLQVPDLPKTGTASQVPIWRRPK